jgi:hypothetical protein
MLTPSFDDGKLLIPLAAGSRGDQEGHAYFEEEDC